MIFCAEPRARADVALERGRGTLLVDAPAALYCAGLEGDARTIGAWQLREDASALRRTTGGPSAIAGEGIFYAALAMRSASTFMECPRDRVLNRNVRGFLAGLRALGLSAHYFGREFVSIDRRPAALIAWTRERNGAVLLELFLGIERPYWSADVIGKTPITVREALGRAPDAIEIGRSIASAFASMGGLEVRDGTIERAPIEEPAFDPEMRFSAPREVPIGIVRAGLAIREELIADAALTGDFFQDVDAPARLRAALANGRASPERVRDALNAAYGAHGAVIEGLKTLQPVLDAFLELI